MTDGHTLFVVYVHLLSVYTNKVFTQQIIDANLNLAVLLHEIPRYTIRLDAE